MNNYEYIIASLPVRGQDIPDADALIEEIKGLCSTADAALVDTLLEGFNPDKLSPAFYEGVSRSRNAFIREYLAFDRNVRNTKVEFLNRTLGRPLTQDLMPASEPSEGEAAEPEVYEERAEVDAVLSRTDILERERGLDNLMWAKADELVLMHLFDMDVILAFIAKLKISDRWNKLDPATGREMFRRLVDEIRKTR